MRIAPLDLRHPAILALHDLRMHDGVQLTNTAGKNQVRQLAPIDGAVFIQDFAAEAANDFVIGDGPGRVKLMRESVSLKEMRATLDQHGRNGRLATGDAARQSYAQHGYIPIIEKLKSGRRYEPVSPEAVYTCCSRAPFSTASPTRPPFAPAAAWPLSPCCSSALRW